MTYKSRLASQDITDLFEAIMTLETTEEYYRFFEDLATVGELQSLAQRLAVAKKLVAEEKYTTIAEETGASTATISRVKRCLNYGADGYKIVFERLAKEGKLNK
jgi:TrpR-related protein YerC/YecD